MTRHRETVLALDFSDGLTEVVEVGIDVVIPGGELIYSRLFSRRLCSFPLCIVGTETYFRPNAIPDRPDELEKHTCLH